MHAIQNDNYERAEANGEGFEIISVGPSSYKPNDERQRTHANYLRHRRGAGFKPPQGFGSSRNAGSFDVQLIQVAR